MYYHELVSMIAKAMSEKNEDALYEVHSKVRDLLLSDDEREAMEQLLEAAIESVIE